MKIAAVVEITTKCQSLFKILTESLQLNFNNFNCLLNVNNMSIWLLNNYIEYLFSSRVVGNINY
jgi:hypothetical protein